MPVNKALSALCEREGCTLCIGAKGKKSQKFRQRAKPYRDDCGPCTILSHVGMTYLNPLKSPTSHTYLYILSSHHLLLDSSSL